MPKSQKQETNVKKKKKKSTRKKKLNAKQERTDKALLKPDNSVGIEEAEVKIEEFIADVSEERASIISIVKGLEGQVETAFKLKEVLEAELEQTQKKLSEEMDARVQLELQVKSLESQAALAEQLREDISFAEEERNKFSNLLDQTQAQLEEVVSERDSLAEQMDSKVLNLKELEGEKIALAAQVMNLKDKILDANRLRKEFAEITESHRSLLEQVHSLTKRLENSEASNESLELELAETRQGSQNLREEIENLRKQSAATDNKTANLRIQFEDQQAANRELMESNTHLENELKMSNINYEAAKNELDAFKNALRDIRSEAALTSGRVRQRYFKPSGFALKSKK